ncbi:hypothetical protein M9H77_30552 [Catharanthus roseus]|uniref:Uncharacterized protein n=1 Tax=Catharanthus roseus TaxID=4058 RepID=A0ACB9ZXJ5_CATRO|nr:hypothetical protein M9H77_30552 [Catharanthus roseus]
MERKRRKWKSLAKQQHLPQMAGQPTIDRRCRGRLGKIQELKTWIKDFGLRLGDSEDDLRRHYSQGCLELKKKEQSRATKWGVYDASSSQFSSEWRMQLDIPLGDYSQYSTYNYTPSVHLSPPRPNLEELVSKVYRFGKHRRGRNGSIP